MGVLCTYFRKKVDGCKTYKGLEEVKSLADKCPMDAGFAVYDARTIYRSYFPASSWMDTLCTMDNQGKERTKEPTTFSQGIKVSPNPANQQLRVFASETFDTDIEVAVFSLSGRQVQSLNWTKETQSLFLDTSTLQDGIYFLELKGNNATVERRKFVVLH